MSNKTELVSQMDMTQLANELTYRKYLFGNDDFRNFFKELRIIDYVVLHTILENEKSAALYSGRTYLKELSDKMQMSIRQTSQVVRELKEKGFLVWSHDGDGSEGTYVTITEEGLERFRKQENSLKNFLGSVIDKFGQENLIQLLRLMKEFGTVFSAELEKKEELGEGEDYE